MKNKQLISVIVSLYNYKKYIKYCVQSILNQTYKNFELIVVDDCSTDNSYEKAKKFEKKDNRVKVIRLDKNSGYSRAKNDGIIRSKGEYITTLDADDMMTKKSLEIRIKNMLNHKVQFIYADAIMVKNDISLNDCYGLNMEKIKDVKIKIAHYDPSNGIYNIHAQSVMMNRDVYKKYGLYDENLRSRSDREMWWRLFGKSPSDKQKIKSYYLNEPVAYYRYHRFSMWRKRKRKPEYDLKVIKKSEKAYEMRKREGINKNNTIFLEK